jgi:PAS domain-containing protein
LDGVITSWNRAAAALLGWSPEDVIGRSLVDVFGCDVRSRAAGHSGLSRVRARVESARGVAIDVDLLVDGESYPVDPRGELMVALVPVAAIAPAGEAAVRHAGSIVGDSASDADVRVRGM